MEAIKGKISGIPVRIEQGDITSKKSGAYIVPQFPTGISKQGVGGAVIRAGAEGGMHAYEDMVKMRRSGFKYGEACITDSEGGNSKYLLHVASAYSGGRVHAFSTVQKATYNALVLAQKRKIKTVAAPALGTGFIGTLSHAQSAKAMMSAIHQFAQDGGKIGEFTFVILGPKEAIDTFQTVLNEKSYENPKPEPGQKRFTLSEWARQMRKEDQLNKSHRQRN